MVVGLGGGWWIWPVVLLRSAIGDGEGNLKVRFVCVCERERQVGLEEKREFDMKKGFWTRKLKKGHAK